MVDITVKVNGATHTSSVEARTTLSDFLRDDLDLTGTHVGCEHGVCGACTVIVA
jgi:aerobic carbon-monoxide dehydrogenase small subunit